MLAVLLTVVTVSLIPGILAVNKCCPANQELKGYGKCGDVDPKVINETYWWFPRDALFNETIRFPNDTREGVRIGFVPCMPHQWYLLLQNVNDFLITDSGELVYYDERSDNTSWTFPERSYCVDRITLSGHQGREFNYHVFLLCATQMTQTQIVCCAPGQYKQMNGDCGNIPRDAPFNTSLKISMDYFTYFGEPGCREQDRSFVIDLNESHHRFIPYNLEIYTIKYKSHSYCLFKDPYNGHIIANFCTTVAETFDFYPYFIFTGVFFFTLTLIFHALLPELRITNHAKYLICHIICLLIGFICVGCAQIKVEKRGTLCFLQGFVTQYSFVAAFFWLNAMCLDISWTFSSMTILHRWIYCIPLHGRDEQKYRKFSRRKSGLRANTAGCLIERNRRKFIRFSIYCWGFPAIISIITAIMQFLPSQKDSLFYPGFGISSCFFQDNSPAIWLFFYGPTLIIMLTNLLLFIFTALRIVSIRRDTQSVLQNQQSATHHRPNTKDQQTFSLYTKLFFLMGASWATEMLSSIFGGPRYYYYFTDTLNLLRAVFIFVFFCCKRKVFILLADHYGGIIPILKRLFPNERKMSKSTTHMTVSTADEQTTRKNEIEMT